MYAWQAQAVPGLVVRTGLRLTAIAVVGQTTLGLTNLRLLDNRFPNLDPAGEGNLPTWLSVVCAFAGAFAPFLHAVVFTERRLLYRSLAAALAYVSLDDFVQIHERLEAEAVRRWDSRSAPPNRLTSCSSFPHWQ